MFYYLYISLDIFRLNIYIIVYIVLNYLASSFYFFIVKLAIYFEYIKVKISFISPCPIFSLYNY
jgi:hypothetical protein